MSAPRSGGTVRRRVSAKRDLLLDTARQYTYGSASEADLLTAAVDYVRVLDESALAKTQREPMLDSEGTHDD